MHLVFFSPPEILWQEVIGRQGRVPAAESLLQRSSRSRCPDWWDRGRDGQRGRQLGFAGAWPWPPQPRRWRVPWQGRRRHPLHLWNVQGRRPYDPVWKVHGKRQAVKIIEKSGWKIFLLAEKERSIFLLCNWWVTPVLVSAFSWDFT